MSKKICCIICTLALLLSGCSNASNDAATTSNGNSKKEANVEESTEQKENSTTDELTHDEKTLGITPEKKVEFIKQYGEEPYSVAMMAVPLYLKLYNNEKSPITEKNIEKYKEKYTVETIKLKSSYDEHTIPADYIINGDKNRDTVVMVHGAGQNRRGNNEQVDLFLSLGYNVLQYDQRSSGENTAPLTTYGILEKYDLSDCVRYIDKEIDEDKKIVLYGKSMGGAAVLSLMGTEDVEQNVDYAILDCPVVSMKQMFYDGVTNYCPKEYIEDAYKSCNLFTDYFYGFTFEDGEAAITAKDTKIPFLMFATEKDEILSYDVQKQFYDAVNSKGKYLYTSKNAKHCCIYSDENATYVELINKFLSGDLVEK